MTNAVFLDSGIFIAFLNKRDRWHVQAAALFGETPPSWSTSMLVVSETYSWFLHKMGEEAARTFRQFVDSLEKLRVFDVAHEHHRDVATMLDRHRGAKLTYVDASSLVFMARHHIEQVWSTDHHLGLFGAEVHPRA